MQTANTRTSLERYRVNKREQRNRYLRDLILRQGRLAVLAECVLGFKLKQFHKDLLERYMSQRRALHLGPRRHGKSSMITIVGGIYEILANPDVRILIVSKTQDKSEQFLFAIGQQFANNQVLRDVFGDYRTGAPKWGVTQITVPQRKDFSNKEPTITASSVGGAVSSRGYNAIYFDDLVDKDNALTEKPRDHLKLWFYQVLLPCLDADGKMHGTGTRFHPLDLYGHMLKNEYKDRHHITDCYTENGDAIWPEQRSLEWLEEQREEMGTAVFNTQYRNNVELMKGQIFKEEWFRYYDTPPLDWKHAFHFAGCDPAATRNAGAGEQSGDWWTIVVGATFIDHPGVYLRYAWRGRVTKDEYIRKCKEVEVRFQPVCWGVENVAAQEYLAQDMEGFASVQRVERFVDKIARAYWLQPKFENGLVLFPTVNDPGIDDIYTALRDELTMFPKAAHDDLFDGLEAMMEVCMEYKAGLGQHNRAVVTQPMRESYDDLD